jgi:hypothetical protein
MIMMMKRIEIEIGPRSKSLLNHTPLHHTTLDTSTPTKQSITYMNCFTHLEAVKKSTTIHLLHVIFEQITIELFVLVEVKGFPRPCC